MDLLNFSLSKANKSVVYFRAKEYPLLLFSSLFKKNKATFVDLSKEDENSLKLKLNMSFLGSSQRFWFGNITEIDDLKKESFLIFLKHYIGPNFVYLFVGDQIIAENFNSEIINCDGLSREQIFILLNNLIDQKVSTKIKSFLDKNIQLTLDQYLLLSSYVQFLNSDIDTFFNKWFSQLFEPELSLFELSKYFFCKDQKKFFELWYQICSRYSDVFWTVFWSEQFFRAFSFIKLNQTKKFSLAKNVAFRLPFSFIQNDWKQVNLRELAVAHKKITDIDFAFKNNCGSLALEELFLSWFCN